MSVTIRISSKEEEKLVLDNLRLVNYLVNKMNVNPNDYDDIVSIGTIGLIKAAATYDKSKKIKFATYASRCINNEILMELRKKREFVASLDEPIGNQKDDGSDEITLAELIPNPDRDFTYQIEERENLASAVSIILNRLSPQRRLIILYGISGMVQREIAGKLNISQSYVSRVEKRAYREIKKYFENIKQYEEVFFVEMVNDTYRIHFSSEDVSEFNKIFATLLKNLTSAEGLPDFRVSCNRKRIVVQIPADHAAFSFIAEIIKEIDNFNITYLSDKTTLHSEKNTVIQKIGDDEAEDEMSEDDAAAGGTTGDNSPTDEDVSKGDVEPVKKSRNGQILHYILSTESSFTVKELKGRFPNFKQSDFGSSLSYAKKKGLIKSEARGVYVRVKNN